MVLYKCDRCGYTTTKTHSFKYHLNRKYPCKIKYQNKSLESIKIKYGFIDKPIIETITIPEKKNVLKQVITLRTRILQIRDVNVNETIGYGGNFKFNKKGKVAIVALGYAEVLLRSLSKSGKAHINDIEIKVAGKISMDLATFDVSNVPEKVLQKCDWIDIISDKQEIDDIAGQANSISYELLTSLGSRVKKEYISENFEKKL